MACARKSTRAENGGLDEIPMGRVRVTLHEVAINLQVTTL